MYDREKKKRRGGTCRSRGWVTALLITALKDHGAGAQRCLGAYPLLCDSLHYETPLAPCPGVLSPKGGGGSHETAVSSVCWVGISLAVSLAERTAWELAVPATEPPAGGHHCCAFLWRQLLGAVPVPGVWGATWLGEQCPLSVSELFLSGNALSSLVGPRPPHTRKPVACHAAGGLGSWASAGRPAPLTGAMLGGNV